MPRPFKCRRIGYMPEITIFKPAGIPMRELEAVSLSFEEVEAIRLKDLEGLEQEQAAKKMNISRPTFQRILFSARKKLADVLLNGKAVYIKGGNFEISFQRFRCQNGHKWNVPLEQMENRHPPKCPVCDIPEISPVSLSEIIFEKKGGCNRRDLALLKSDLQAETSYILQDGIEDKIPRPG